MRKISGAPVVSWRRKKTFEIKLFEIMITQDLVLPRKLLIIEYKQSTYAKQQDQISTDCLPGCGPEHLFRWEELPSKNDRQRPALLSEPRFKEKSCTVQEFITEGLSFIDIGFLKGRVQLDGWILSCLIFITMRNPFRGQEYTDGPYTYRIAAYMGESGSCSITIIVEGESTVIKGDLLIYAVARIIDKDGQDDFNSARIEFNLHKIMLEEYEHLGDIAPTLYGYAHPYLLDRYQTLTQLYQFASEHKEAVFNLTDIAEKVKRRAAKTNKTISFLKGEPIDAEGMGQFTIVGGNTTGEVIKTRDGIVPAIRITLQVTGEDLGGMHTYHVNSAIAKYFKNASAIELFDYDQFTIKNVSK